MRDILIPIQVDPVKPLGLSHIRHIMYVDYLWKSLELNGRDVVYVYNGLRYALDAQVIKLANYMDARRISPRSELEVGLTYVKMNAEPYDVIQSEFLKTREKVEHGAKMPFHEQVIVPAWKQNYERLSLRNPGLESYSPFKLSFNETLEFVQKQGRLFDTRETDGNVYVDYTDRGWRLRRIAGESAYSYNYFFSFIRELVSVVQPGDKLHFIYDPDVLIDFRILGELFKGIGCQVRYHQNNRVSVNNSVLSARNGGWQGYTVSDILSKYEAQFCDAEIASALKWYLLSAVPMQSVLNFEFSEFETYLENVVSRVGYPKKKNVLRDSSFISPRSYYLSL